MKVYFGPKTGSVNVNTPSDSTYTFTFTVPAMCGILTITYDNPPPAVPADFIVDNIQITRQ